MFYGLIRKKAGYWRPRRKRTVVQIVEGAGGDFVTAGITEG
jgi:hypothetical protein